MGMIEKSALLVLLTLGLLAGCGDHNQEQPKTSQPQASQQASQSAPAATTSNTPSDGKPLVTGLPDFSPLVEKEGPAVVNISSVTHESDSDRQKQLDQMPEFFRHFFKQFGGPDDGVPGGGGEVESLGSGFIISSDGDVLTNYHVVKGADEIIVRLQDRRELDAKLVGYDKQSDLALLKINAKDLPVVSIGSSKALKVGQWVVAIGAPFGFDSSVTAGIVSAKDRSLPSDNYVPFIQTDVAINPGNSGGPLINMKGEVVGINSQIVSRSGGYMGLSFAIPIDLAMNVVEQIKTHGSVSHGWLGVLIQEVNSDLAKSFGLDRPMGALVAQVQSGSPADQAGLKPGDIIIGFDGHHIERSAELPKVVGSMVAGSKADMTVIRNGDKKTLTVTLGELPDNPQEAMLKGSGGGEAAHSDSLGLSVRDASKSELARINADGGVIVTHVDKGPAADAGIQQGDILISLDGKAVDNADDYRKAVQALPKEGTVPALINRDGGARFLALKLGS